MKKIYRKMMVLMNRKQKLKMVQILFMMVIGAVLETVSIGLVVPAIQMIMDPSCVRRQRPGADLPMDRLSETGIFRR
ncbi:MAG: hypothetical protein ACLURV_14135 [Gallintestinimicrobium sp.]